MTKVIHPYGEQVGMRHALVNRTGRGKCQHSLLVWVETAWHGAAATRQASCSRRSGAPSRACGVGLGRIIASEIEAPNMLVDLV
jgi:hypothetical protein